MDCAELSKWIELVALADCKRSAAGRRYPDSRSGCIAAFSGNDISGVSAMPIIG